MIDVNDVCKIIVKAINDWTLEFESNGYGIPITEEIRDIREFNSHRSDIADVVYELSTINSQMWHEQDGIRSEDDNAVLESIEKIHPLNQHRNDLIEEIDEIVADWSNKSYDEKFTANSVVLLIQNIIERWHNEHTLFTEVEDCLNSLNDIVSGIALINTIAWHEEDRVRKRISDQDVVETVRRMNMLNKNRNLLIEGLDDYLIDYFSSDTED